MNHRHCVAVAALILLSANAQTQTLVPADTNVVTVAVRGGGGGGGGADSGAGGNGAAGPSIMGLIQVEPGMSVTDYEGAGGRGGANINRSSSVTTSAAGGNGFGAGGAGGLNRSSGGGGGGGGASAIHIDGETVASGFSAWVRAGGGGGGGGGSTTTRHSSVAAAYNSGKGLDANQRYASAPSTTSLPAVLDVTPTMSSGSNLCGIAAVGLSGGSAASDGGGGGGNGGSFNGPAVAASLGGRDQYWNAEGGLTGASCQWGNFESISFNANGGGAGGVASTGGGTPNAATDGGRGEATFNFVKDQARIPTLGAFDPIAGTISVNPPATLPPNNTVHSYAVTCTAPGTADVTGTGTASPISLTALVPGINYSCVVVAQLQDATDIATIKTLASESSAASVPYQAPVITNATSGDAQGSLTISPPANLPAGVTVNDYTATCTPTGGGAPVTASGVSPLTVPGLTNGQTYDCTVTAALSDGTTSVVSNSMQLSPAASATPTGTSSVTPVPTGGALALSLMGLGIAGLATRRLRRKQTQ